MGSEAIGLDVLAFVNTLADNLDNISPGDCIEDFHGIDTGVQVIMQVSVLGRLNQALLCLATRLGSGATERRKKPDSQKPRLTANVSICNWLVIVCP
jgi:hypothetical protein